MTKTRHVQETTRRAPSAVLGMLLLLAGCGGSGGGADAAAEAGTDAATEAGTDAAAEAGTDAATEAGTDAARDAAAEAGTDAAAEAGTDAAADAPSPGCDPITLPTLRAEDLGRFNAPVFATQAPGRPGDVFVVEQGGRIRIWRSGGTLDTPFLDIRDRVRHAGERGLLGLAFHPDFETNGRFFVYYTPSGAMRNVVAEYRRSPDDPDVADSTELRRLLNPMDPEGNHNGGMLAFGPDGYLYVGMGDGGGGCDRHGSIGNAQDLESPFGKIHRLDVDAAGSRLAPADNPFVGATGLDTIWAYGLRNPWRFSFDRVTGDLYVGDVGQNTWEEVTVQPAGTPAGRNYGWRDYEGLERSTASGCMPTGRVTEENHFRPALTVRLGSSDEVVRDACAIIGGYVYRGSAIPQLRGYYLYGDFCSGDVAAFRYCDGMVVGHQRLTIEGRANRLASFGEGLDGELYLVFLSGRVQRLVPGP